LFWEKESAKFLKESASMQEIKTALYIVATPIGNLEDITLRALEILKVADFIVCEDSRVTQRLLMAHKIADKKFILYNDHSDEKTREKILNFLIQGKILALVSDAGTPLISDPGYKLISYLKKYNQKVIPLPGASAVTSALCASGLACDNFLFLGFLPTSEIQKTKLLKSLPKNFTFIFFESAHRALESLNLVFETLGNRKCCAARELTKIHEEIISDEVKNVINFFENDPGKLRGEFVIIVEKADKSEKNLSEEELIKEIKSSIDAGLSLKDLSQNLAEIHGLNKKEIYQLALTVR
jgi:16S rRNA (cytidine1402-2'-O)-methyltransferase